HYSHAGLLVPNFAANNRSYTQLFRDGDSFLKTALGFPVELEPAAGELFDRNRYREVVGNHLTQRRRRPWPLGQQPRVKYQGIVGYRLPVLQSLGPQPDQVKQMVRKTVSLAALIRHREPVLLPRLEKQRGHPVVEDVKEISQGIIFGPYPVHDQLGV